MSGLQSGARVVSRTGMANHCGVGSGGASPMSIGAHQPPPRQPTCASEIVVCPSQLPCPRQGMGSGTTNPAVCPAATFEAQRKGKGCNG